MDPSKLFCCNFPRKILLSDNRKKEQTVQCSFNFLFNQVVDSNTHTLMVREGKKNCVGLITSNVDPILSFMSCQDIAESV